MESPAFVRTAIDMNCIQCDRLIEDQMMAKTNVVLVGCAVVFGLGLLFGCGDPDDNGSGPALTPSPDARNACGGNDDLTLDGDEVGPGDDCGPCDDGIVVCDGSNALRCSQASEPTNECGGCEPLHAETGEVCGPCDQGSWECDGDGGLECIDEAEPNACQGCGELDAEPGTVCGDDDEGLIACAGPEEVRCVEEGENACGGHQPLDAEPGTSCGICDQGVVACEGETETTCVDEERGLNDCGGCQNLPGIVGNLCGACDGELACDGDNDLTCEEGATNVCGGCDELDEEPGEECETGFVFSCDDTGSVSCAESASHACGGTSVLHDEAGSSCGPCGEGEYVCSGPDVLSCAGASRTNACGGCDRLPAQPMESCGECDNGTRVCSTANDVVCVGASTNACGGCEPLAAEPGTVCPDGGIRECADDGESVECVGWEPVEDDIFEELGEFTLQSIWASGPEDVWAVGDMDIEPDETTVFHYGGDDDGWERERVEVDGELVDTDWRGVWSTGPDDVWIVGVATDTDFGPVVQCCDADGEWVAHSEAIEDLELAGDFIGWHSIAGYDSDIWIAGDGYVIHWSDGDGEWSEVLDGGEEQVFSDIEVNAPDDIWVMATSNDWTEEPSGLFHYSGGDTWDDDFDFPTDLDEDSVTFTGLWSSGPDDVWLTINEQGDDGLEGDVWRYDGSATMPTEYPLDDPVAAVAGHDFADVWVVGWNGTIAHFNGNFWNVVQSPADIDLTDVATVETGSVWAVGLGGTILRYVGAEP